MKIGNVSLASPYAIAPMAGMTDTAFRRLVKRQGGCGLVVTEMVSAEGLVRGIDRTLDTPSTPRRSGRSRSRSSAAIPGTMAEAARIVAGPRRRHRRRQHGLPGAEDRQAQRRLQPDARAGARRRRSSPRWREPSDPGDGQDAGRVERARDQRADAGRMVADAGAAAVAVHGRTAAQSLQRIVGLGPDLRVAAACRDPGARQRRLRRARPDHRAAARPRVERRARRPRRAAKPVDSGAGAGPRGGPRRPRRDRCAERGQFLLEYMDLLLHERVGEAEGFRHIAGSDRAADGDANRPRTRAVGDQQGARARHSGTRRGSRTAPTCGSRSTAASRWPALRETIAAFFFEGRTVFCRVSAPGSNRALASETDRRRRPARVSGPPRVTRAAPGARRTPRGRQQHEREHAPFIRIRVALAASPCRSAARCRAQSPRSQ